MFQHALDDPVGALAVLGDLVEVAGQHLDRLVDRPHARPRRAPPPPGCRFLQLVSSNSPDSSANLLTKLSGFLISCAMPAVSWPSAAIFWAWNRLGLRRLQFVQGPLGGVARRADLGLGTLALGDVAVDQHNTAARYRVAAHLDDRPSGRVRSKPTIAFRRFQRAGAPPLRHRPRRTRHAWRDSGLNLPTRGRSAR